MFQIPPSQINKTIAECEELIAKETETITRMELQGNPYRGDTSEWHVWQTELKDAYWRRRNWVWKLETLKEEERAPI